MTVLSERMPPKNELFLVLAACIFPIHVWISLVLLYKFPSLILKANIGQILGVFAYTLVFTLFESLLFFGFLILIAVALPAQYFRSRFVHRGTLIALSLAVFALILNFWILADNKLPITIIAIIFFLFIVYVSRYSKKTDLVVSFAERLIVISVIFVIADVLSIFFILFRQLI